MATKTPADRAAAARVRGLSLHIGLNAVDPHHYGGWSGDLAACEYDARDMAAIAQSKGMQATVLLTRKATRAAVLAAMRKAAKTLRAGDLFMLTYSGHGGQVPDTNGDEADRQDETWCLFDAQLVDDELYYELSRFGAGVRILVLSDSCHSGTVTRDLPSTVAIVPTGQPPQRPRLMPRSIALRTYRDNQAFYDRLQRDVAKASGGAGGIVDPDTALANVVMTGRLAGVVTKFNPAVLLISGCQDNQTSMDGEQNGLFTEQVLAVWNNGAFQGNYSTFHARVRSRLPPTQSPNLFTLGDAAAFAAQQPFSLE